MPSCSSSQHFWSQDPITSLNSIEDFKSFYIYGLYPSILTVLEIKIENFLKSIYFNKFTIKQTPVT